MRHLYRFAVLVSSLLPLAFVALPAAASTSADDTTFWLTGWIFGKRTAPRRDIGICNPICLTGQSYAGPWEPHAATESRIGIDGQDAPFIAIHGATPTCTISLDQPAPESGVLVLLSSSDPTIISPPEWVMISHGDRSISFPIDLIVTAKSRTAMITAKDGNVVLSVKVTVSSQRRGD